MDSAVQAGQKLKCTPEEACAEVERELQVRNRIYDNWVRDGKLSYIDARDRYGRMQQAFILLKRTVELQSAPTEEFTPAVVNG